MSTDSWGIFLGFNVEFHTSCESDVEHSITKSIATPRHENQVNFDHPHKKQPIDPHTNKETLIPQKTSSFWPQNWTQVDFHPHS